MSNLEKLKAESFQNTPVTLHILIVFLLLCGTALQSLSVGQLDHTVYLNLPLAVPDQMALYGGRGGDRSPPMAEHQIARNQRNFTLMGQQMTRKSKDRFVLKKIQRTTVADLRCHKASFVKYFVHFIFRFNSLFLSIIHFSPPRQSTQHYLPSSVLSILFNLQENIVFTEKRYLCPAGLTSGDVFWDDEDTWNTNRYAGTLPDGTYNTNTWIYFCCRTDGDNDNPILLPSESPFYLLAYESAKCQMVKWSVVSLEWIYFDTEDWNNQDQADGAYPHDAGKAPPTIYYCYYRSEKIITL